MPHTPFTLHFDATPEQQAAIRAKLGVLPGQSSGKLSNERADLYWHAAEGGFDVDVLALHGFVAERAPEDAVRQVIAGEVGLGVSEQNNVLEVTMREQPASLGRINLMPYEVPLPLPMPPANPDNAPSWKMVADMQREALNAVGGRIEIQAAEKLLRIERLADGYGRDILVIDGVKVTPEVLLAFVNPDPQNWIWGERDGDDVTYHEERRG